MTTSEFQAAHNTYVISYWREALVKLASFNLKPLALLLGYAVGNFFSFLFFASFFYLLFITRKTISN